MGLRLRLLLGAATWIGGALLVAGFAISYLFAGHVERAARLDLTAQINRLVALVDVDANPPQLLQPLADPRFGVPFGGLYWQITDIKTGETGRSRSLWDGQLTLAEPLQNVGSIHAVQLSGPDGAPNIGIARRLEFHPDNGDARVFDIIVSENRDGIEAATAAFRLDLARALLILGIVLVLAAWAQVSIGLAPLKKIKEGISAIRTGRRTKLDDTYPLEVMPLTEEVNALMELQNASIAFARARAADLAHALKTQLTVLSAEAHALREKGLAKEAEAIEGLMASMTETINHQLTLSRLRFRTRTEHYASDLPANIAKLVTTLSKTPKGESLNWQVDLPQHVAVDVDKPDLNELFGILLDNACQWAAKTVELTGQLRAGAIEVKISDDGPGLSAEKIAQLGTRGKRLDERRSGSGIGISIAKEIVDLNNARMRFARSPKLGGLEVHLTIPLAKSAAPIAAQ